MNDWSLPYVARQTIKQFLTPSGLMMLGSFLVTAYVGIHNPQHLMWPAIWNAMMVFNHTGRWILPQWIASKVNGSPSPAAKATP